MTARNMQDKVKGKGLPWSAAKGFDSFCPVSPFIERSAIPDYANVNLWLKVGVDHAQSLAFLALPFPLWLTWHVFTLPLLPQTNGQTRQDGNTRDMLFTIPQLIEHVSSIMSVEEGDLLLTGACGAWPGLS